MTIQADYARWHWLQIATGDIDPAYPVLKQIGGAVGAEQTAWLILHHTSYYHLGSGLASFCIAGPGQPLSEDLLRLPTGTERRGNRSIPNFAKHWQSVRETINRDAGGSALAWLTPSASGTAGWDELRTRIEGVHGNGRWASYKIAELSQKVLDTPIRAPDAGHADSTGPRKGLGLLLEIPSGNSDSVIQFLDGATESLRQTLGEPDVAQVETSLCDFHSLTKGRYYLGKDIDEQLHHLTQVPSALTSLALAARRVSFPHAYLPELTGRPAGVDKDRQRHYAQTGEILERRS